MIEDQDTGMLRDPPASPRSLTHSTGTSGHETVPLGHHHGLPPRRQGRRRRRNRGLRVEEAGRIRRALGGDRGAVSAELVIATPLLLLILLVIVQFALWSHATHIAQAAASQGLSAVRAQDGTVAEGTASAQQVLDQLARGPLTGTSISTDRGADSAAVRISGSATSVIPFLHLPVHAEITGPVERFVPDLAAGR